jgi:hypothetical protein
MERALPEYRHHTGTFLSRISFLIAALYEL